MVLKMIITKLVKKIGMQKLLFLIGDMAVKATKSKQDDKVWAKVRKVLDKV
jgi:calcineurin-like phosphoesterase family protein